MDILGKLARLARRVTAAGRRGQLDADLAEEIRQHIEWRARALAESGMDPREARDEARRMFGNSTAIREETRDMWTFQPLAALAQDLRYGMRLMRRSPVFSAVSILSLAVAIAASTVVTGIVNASLWRWSAMYDDPSRLVLLWQTRNENLWTPTPADVRDWQAMTRSFTSVQAYTYRSLNFSAGADPEQLSAAAVTPGLFATLGVRPLAGTGFRGDEETWGRHRRVLLSEGLWRRRFGADPSIVGRTLTLNGEPHDVAGVMPAGTWFTAARPDVFVPYAFAPDDPSNNRNSHFVWAVARLRPDVSLDMASAEMAVIARQLEAIHPANKGLGAAARRISDQVLENPRRTLALLGGAVLLVLLIASANVAGLQLVRAAARQRELAVRMSLGASRARVARQLLTEGMLLAIAGGIAGLALGAAAARLVPPLLPADLPRIAETGIPLDWRVLAGALAAIIVCGLFTGFLPAITTGRSGPAGRLKESTRTMAGGPGQTRLRSVLVCGEIVITVMLVAGAALLVRSFGNLQRTELGARTSSLVTLRLPLAPGRGRAVNAAATSRYLDAIAEAARSTPGVLDADITSHVPLGGGGQSKHFFVVGQTPPARYEEVPTVSLRQEGPRALQTLGARLVRGRFFADTDVAGAPPVAIVNTTLARRFFAGSDPVGQVICLQAPEHLSPPDNVKAAGGSFVRWTVVGVIDDIRYTHPSEPLEPTVHVPHRQRTPQALMGWAPDFLVLHTSLGADVMPPLRERLRDVAPGQPLAQVRTIETLAAEAFGGARVIAVVLSSLSGVALFLAAIGVYGAVASSVSARTPEIGIRVALGAQPQTVVWLVVRQAALVAVAGVAVGLGSAAAAARAIETQLHGIAPRDLTSFLLAPLVVCATTALAAWIPGRRAARIDPVTALRND